MVKSVRYLTKSEISEIMNEHKSDTALYKQFMLFFSESNDTGLTEVYNKRTLPKRLFLFYDFSFKI